MYLYEVATESVCESAARLLFMSIKWAKSVPAFSTLSLQDQVRPAGPCGPVVGSTGLGGKRAQPGLAQCHSARSQAALEDARDQLLY